MEKKIVVNGQEHTVEICNNISCCIVIVDGISFMIDASREWSYRTYGENNAEDDAREFGFESVKAMLEHYMPVFKIVEPVQI